MKNKDKKELALKWLFRLKYQLENVIASENKYDDFSQDKEDLEEVNIAYEWLINVRP